MTIFFQVVLPVILVFFIGFIVQKWRDVDIKPISTVAVYILTPSLVFRTFYEAELNLQYLYMFLFAMLLLFALIAINKVYVVLRGYSQATESGLVLSTAFMNSGNYGAPIILFAYGNTGFAFAVSFMVLQSVIMNFFGVYYAARGKAGVRMAIRAVMQMPATYAVIVALALQAIPVEIPANFLMTVDIIAEAAVPTVMIILGMQLAMIKWEHFDWSKITYGTILRLIVSPLIAFGITLVFPFDPLLAKVLIVSAAMPSAATIVMYAVQFQAEPRLVTSITLITTLFSVVTITVLLAILG
ncbi:AEC family transporter [Halalkalibacterium halodurans]|uniref:AEC family transporter n=1 Tax=Halalkalibacterium halodurans TaxID=86665 RepID=UPI002AA9745C|nr:AEC family transporter [Halalkalibacterium halodurans]MDY7223204.1 AEC family transporter [Halalkalibacterium halodurans]MDY7242425.1 AEC family transporter [Halalkalibacterium halodurans]MED4081458.1 AEC family transporter [Halalkalibacterium halodurans]MED4086966.1 AEC family transporter [Halalkalibacterium halodurans]MED4107053.1 AEC family transporter [Halalkalibacterium halodurans]